MTDKTDKAEKINIEIKVAKVFFYLGIAVGFLILAASLLAFLAKIGDSILPPLCIAAIGLACIFKAFYRRSERIYITDMDVKYVSWFHRKAIKTVESFNTTGIWIFNSVVFTGRGRSVIRLSNVENLDAIRKLVESIDHLKSKD